MNPCQTEQTAVDPGAHAVARGNQNVNAFSLYSFLREDFSESEERFAAQMCARWVLDIECELLRTIVEDARAKLIDAHRRQSLEPFDSLVRDLDQVFQIRQAAYTKLPVTNFSTRSP